jgi:hypothetical protein
MMFKVIKPLKGYGYVAGDQTDKINPSDAKLFLAYGLIEEVTSPAPAQPKKGKK